jgi:hypothetical protein
METPNSHSHPHQPLPTSTSSVSFPQDPTKKPIFKLEMQLPSLSVLILATVTAFGDTASASAKGTQGTGAAFHKYTVKANGVPNIPGVCGGLWSNLKRFGSCTVTRAWCEGTKGKLVWELWVPVGCNNGMIHSAWREATKNKWGSITCS